MRKPAPLCALFALCCACQRVGKAPPTLPFPGGLVVQNEYIGCDPVRLRLCRPRVQHVARFKPDGSFVDEIRRPTFSSDPRHMWESSGLRITQYATGLRLLEYPEINSYARSTRPPLRALELPDPGSDCRLRRNGGQYLPEAYRLRGRDVVQSQNTYRFQEIGPFVHTTIWLAPNLGCVEVQRYERHTSTGDTFFRTTVNVALQPPNESWFKRTSQAREVSPADLQRTLLMSRGPTATRHAPVFRLYDAKLTSYLALPKVLGPFEDPVRF